MRTLIISWDMRSSLRSVLRLSAIVPFVVMVLNVSAASAQISLGSAQSFAVLAGTAVTCTGSAVTGDLGVWPGTAVTATGCTVVGMVHPGDQVAQQAYLDFISAYNNLRDHPPACKATATATLTETLLPGVYCVDATAKAGPLMLDAQGDPNATWTFLVNGALTGTTFNVVMLNGGNPCNVSWWVNGAATLTGSNFLGTILAGAAITVTGGTFSGHALATAAVTLTTTKVSACTTGTVAPPPPPDLDKCEEHHDKDGDDRDKDTDHHDKDRDHHDRDRDHHDGDRDHHDGDKDHHGNDKDNDR